MFVALATGGAYAANNLVGSSDIAANAILSKHIKGGNVRTSDLADNSVTTAKVADGSLLGSDFAAGQLPAGPQGPQGDQGVPGTARAYAEVISNCTGGPFPTGVCQTNPAHTKGVSNVTRISNGMYCVTAPGIDSATVPAIATVDIYDTGGGFTMPTVWVGGVCPTPSDFMVQTARDNNANNGTLDNNVSFDVLIP